MKSQEHPSKRLDTSKTLTELGLNLRTTSFILISFGCNFGPVWYHPTILSFAKEKGHSYHPSKHSMKHEM